MDFLDQVLAQCGLRGVDLRDPLDAQSIVWWITKNDPPEHWEQSTKEEFLRYRRDLLPDGSDDGYTAPDLQSITDSIREAGLKIEDRILRRYHASIRSKGFVILSGVSGTGKTWLAQEYAKAIKGKHLVVPVAPNWTTNEDLLGYQNPLSDEYHHTPFSKFLVDASAEWPDALSVNVGN